ncbi:MAG: division plane positioning ATPase MipZ [Rhodothalassiaceae bacterium]
MSAIPQQSSGAHIIVLGNEKGGSGKSTTAMHLVIGLMSDGYRVAALDLDVRQRSLTRYLENRARFAADSGLALSEPIHRVLAHAAADTRRAAESEEQAAFEQALSDLRTGHDVVVIDCPGNDTHLARLAHAEADTLVTPLNDSFVDLDLLARVNRDTLAVESPSLYAELVWEAKKRKAARGRGPIDWVVMRSRTASLNARNKARVERVLRALAKRIGFRFVPGLSERVIYRELFLKGLTLIDFGRSQTPVPGRSMTMSHVAARLELRRLIDALELPPPPRMLDAAE